MFNHTCNLVDLDEIKKNALLWFHNTHDDISYPEVEYDLIQKLKISMSIITIEFDLVHDSVCVDKLSLTTFLSVIKLSIVRELIKKFSFSDYLNFEEIT